jgi:hypothetical protein
MSHMNSFCHYLEFRINGHMNSYSFMNSYDGRSYNLSTDILWPFIQPKCKFLNRHMNSYVYMNSYVHCNQTNLLMSRRKYELHVHLNSYVTNNKFPMNNIKILCLINFFLQNPTTSMRNWVCPHKS